MSDKTVSYQDIFEDITFEDADDARSVLSPAAYLADLLFLKEDIGQDGEISDRRKDIKEIPLNREKTYKMVPYLSIANKVMENYLSTQGVTDVDEALATAAYPFNAPYSLPYNESHVKMKKNLNALKTDMHELYMTLTDNPDTLIAAKEILGLSYEELEFITTDNGPQESTLWNTDLEEAYKTYVSKLWGLDQGVSDITINNLKEVKTFLELAMMSEKELKEILYQNCSKEELSVENNVPIPARNSFGHFFINNGVLGEKTGVYTEGETTSITVDETEENIDGVITETGRMSGTKQEGDYLTIVRDVNDGPKLQVLNVTGGEPIQIDPTIDYYDRINRFVRLAKALDWSYQDLDSVLMTICGGVLSNETIPYIAVVKVLHDNHRLPIEQICALFTNLKDFGKSDLSEAVDLFTSVFENGYEDTIFSVTDPYEFETRLMSTLGISQTDYKSMYEYLYDPKANIQPQTFIEDEKKKYFSSLFRIVLLSRVCDKSVPHILVLMSIVENSLSQFHNLDSFGLSIPFAKPSGARIPSISSILNQGIYVNSFPEYRQNFLWYLQMVMKVSQWADEYSITIPELNFMINGDSDSTVVVDNMLSVNEIKAWRDAFNRFCLQKKDLETSQVKGEILDNLVSVLENNGIVTLSKDGTDNGILVFDSLELSDCENLLKEAGLVDPSTEDDTALYDLLVQKAEEQNMAFYNIMQSRFGFSINTLETVCGAVCKSPGENEKQIIENVMFPIFRYADLVDQDGASSYELSKIYDEIEDFFKPLQQHLLMIGKVGLTDSEVDTLFKLHSFSTCNINDEMRVPEVPEEEIAQVQELIANPFAGEDVVTVFKLPSNGNFIRVKGTYTQSFTTFVHDGSKFVEQSTTTDFTAATGLPLPPFGQIKGATNPTDSELLLFGNSSFVSLQGSTWGEELKLSIDNNLMDLSSIDGIVNPTGYISHDPVTFNAGDKIVLYVTPCISDHWQYVFDSRPNGGDAFFAIGSTNYWSMKNCQVKVNGTEVIHLSSVESLNTFCIIEVTFNTTQTLNRILNSTTEGWEGVIYFAKYIIAGIEQNVYNFENIGNGLKYNGSNQCSIFNDARTYNGSFPTIGVTIDSYVSSASNHVFCNLTDGINTELFAGIWNTNNSDFFNILVRDSNNTIFYSNEIGIKVPKIESSFSINLAYNNATSKFEFYLNNVKKWESHVVDISSITLNNARLNVMGACRNGLRYPTKGCVAEATFDDITYISNAEFGSNLKGELNNGASWVGGVEGACPSTLKDASGKGYDATIVDGTWITYNSVNDNSLDYAEQKYAEEFKEYKTEVDSSYIDETGMYLFCGDQVSRMVSSTSSEVAAGYPQKIHESDLYKELFDAPVSEVSAVFKIDDVLFLQVNGLWTKAKKGDDGAYTKVSSGHSTAELFGKVDNLLERTDAEVVATFQGKLFGDEHDALYLFVTSGNETQYYRYSNATTLVGITQCDEGYPRNLRQAIPSDVNPADLKALFKEDSTAFPMSTALSIKVPESKTYLFSDNSYVCSDNFAERLKVSDLWLDGSTEGIFSTIDAGFVSNHGWTYLFSGTQFIRYSNSDYSAIHDTNALDTNSFFGITASKIDAAFMMPVNPSGGEGQMQAVLLFDGKYARFVMKADGTASKISEDGEGLIEDFDSLGSAYPAFYRIVDTTKEKYRVLAVYSEIVDGFMVLHSYYKHIGDETLCYKKYQVSESGILVTDEAIPTGLSEKISVANITSIFKGADTVYYFADTVYTIQSISGGTFTEPKTINTLFGRLGIRPDVRAFNSVKVAFRGAANSVYFVGESTYLKATYSQDSYVDGFIVEAGYPRNNMDFASEGISGINLTSPGSNQLLVKDIVDLRDDNDIHKEYLQFTSQKEVTNGITTQPIASLGTISNGLIKGEEITAGLTNNGALYLFTGYNENVMIYRYSSFKGDGSALLDPGYPRRYSDEVWKSEGLSYFDGATWVNLYSPTGHGIKGTFDPFRMRYVSLTHNENRSNWSKVHNPIAVEGISSVAQLNGTTYVFSKNYFGTVDTGLGKFETSTLKPISDFARPEELPFSFNNGCKFSFTYNGEIYTGNDKVLWNMSDSTKTLVDFTTITTSMWVRSGTRIFINDIFVDISISPREEAIILNKICKVDEIIDSAINSNDHSLFRNDAVKSVFTFYSAYQNYYYYLSDNYFAKVHEAGALMEIGEVWRLYADFSGIALTDLDRTVKFKALSRESIYDGTDIWNDYNTKSITDYVSQFNVSADRLDTEVLSKLFTDWTSLSDKTTFRNGQKGAATALFQMAKSKIGKDDRDTYSDNIDREVLGQRRDALVGFSLYVLNERTRKALEQKWAGLNDLFLKTHNPSLLEQIDEVEEQLRIFPEGITTTRDLYGHLLTDMMMSEDTDISEIKEAILSMQLYYHRFLMGLEEEYEGQVYIPVKKGEGTHYTQDGVAFNAITGDESPSVEGTHVIKPNFEGDLKEWWEWMQNYRVWEANRKVFMYPENYIRPELRPDKSPEFAELERSVLENEITDENVQKAFNKYMDGFNKVSQLNVVGGYVYHDESSDVAESQDLTNAVMFGSTKVEPYEHFYAVGNLAATVPPSSPDEYYAPYDIEWNAWQKIHINIQANSVRPVFAFGKMFVFWIEYRMGKSSSSSESNAEVFEPIVYYSFYNLNKEWEPKKEMVNLHDYMGSLSTAQKSAILVKDGFTLNAEFKSQGSVKEIQIWATSDSQIMQDNEIANLQWKMFDSLDVEHDRKEKRSSSVFPEEFDISSTSSKAAWQTITKGGGTSRWYSFSSKGGSALCMPLAGLESETVQWDLVNNGLNNVDSAFYSTVEAISSKDIPELYTFGEQGLRRKVDNGSSTSVNISSLFDVTDATDFTNYDTFQRSPFTNFDATNNYVVGAFCLERELGDGNTDSTVHIITNNGYYHEYTPNDPADADLTDTLSEDQISRDILGSLFTPKTRYAGHTSDILGYVKQVLNSYYSYVPWDEFKDKYFPGAITNAFSIGVSGDNHFFIADNYYTCIGDRVSEGYPHGLRNALNTAEWHAIEGVFMDSLGRLVLFNNERYVFFDLTEQRWKTPGSKVADHGEYDEFITSRNNVQKANGQETADIYARNTFIHFFVTGFTYKKVQHIFARGTNAHVHNNNRHVYFSSITTELDDKGDLIYLDSDIVMPPERNCARILWSGSEHTESEIQTEKVFGDLTPDIMCDAAFTYQNRLVLFSGYRFIEYIEGGSSPYPLNKFYRHPNMQEFKDIYSAFKDVTKIKAAFVQSNILYLFIDSKSKNETTQFFKAFKITFDSQTDLMVFKELKDGLEEVTTDNWGQLPVEALTSDKLAIASTQIDSHSWCSVITTKKTIKDNEEVWTTTQKVSGNSKIPVNQALSKYAILRLNSKTGPQLLEKIFSFGIDSFLTRETQHEVSEIPSYINSEPDGIEIPDNTVFCSKHYFEIVPNKILGLDFNGALKSYYWEIFFHIPYLIANRLNEQQRFEESKKWFEYIFNPIDPTLNKSIDVLDGESMKVITSGNYWNFLEFFWDQYRWEATSEKKGGFLAGEKKQLKVTYDDPFSPHAIAKERTVAYRKSIVMAYVDNLIDWGDNLFREYTHESINEARMLYMLAYDLLGKKPVSSGDMDLSDDKKFNEISSQILTFDDAGSITSGTLRYVDIENAPIAETGDVTTHDVTFTSNLTGVRATPNDTMVTGDYFYMPENVQFVKYWDRIEDRIGKIRNGQNIDGVKVNLPLFQPPIDPMALVKNKGNLGSISKALASLNAPVPHYRYNFMSAKAKELASRLTGLGSSMLSALEKKDAEELSHLRRYHEKKLLELSQEIREAQLEDRMVAKSVLRKNLESAEYRRDEYKNRKFMSTLESGQISTIATASILRGFAGVTKDTAVAATAIPDNMIGPIPSTIVGGSQVFRTAKFKSGALNLAADIVSTSGNLMGTMAGYQRRQEDWNFQAELAQKEIDAITLQLEAADIQIANARREIRQAELQRKHNESVDLFMTSKFTNKELYQWMSSKLSGLFYQTYQMALDLAKQAQQSFRFELGLKEDEVNYLTSYYWDSQKKGLLAGEVLMSDLDRMDKGYMEKNSRRFEISKSVSLLDIAPEAVLDLKSKKKCNFTLSEKLFALDFPSHYGRQIKSISVTIPAVVGPYQNVNASLTQQSHYTLLEPDAASMHYLMGFVDAPTEGAVRADWRGQQQIAVSRGVNDSGLFQLNFNDERYLPFEGTGAFSTWQLELTGHSGSFDLSTISDVIINVEYTALQGGDQFGTSVATELEKETFTERKYLDVPQHFSTEWHTYQDAPEAGLQVVLTGDMFPGLEARAGEAWGNLMVYNPTTNEVSHQQLSEDLSNGVAVTLGNVQGDALVFIVEYEMKYQF